MGKLPRIALVALDLGAILILRPGLYFPSHRGKDTLVAYLGTNIGVLAVAIALTSEPHVLYWIAENSCGGCHSGKLDESFDRRSRHRKSRCVMVVLNTSLRGVFPERFFVFDSVSRTCRTQTTNLRPPSIELQIC